MSTTQVETWAGADLSQIGPLYPMVGSEMYLFIAAVAFWILFHILQSRIEKTEMNDDEALARSPDRLQRVFEQEAQE